MFRRMLRQLSLVTAVLLTPVIAAPASAVEMTDRSFPLSEPRADVLAMRDRGQNVINLAGNFLLAPTRGNPRPGRRFMGGAGRKSVGRDSLGQPARLALQPF